MVLPPFVRQAFTGEPVSVYGDGAQKRCFAMCTTLVEAILRLLDSEAAQGQVFNIGPDREISIYDLAQRVITRAESTSEIRLIPYDVTYDEGFEELGRRKPDTTGARRIDRLGTGAYRGRRGR